MIMQRFINSAAPIFWLALLIAPAVAQSTNLLRNPDAVEGTSYWRVFGDAAIEETAANIIHFRVRNHGYFFQDVSLPEDAGGRYALLIGLLSSERINADGSITGLPLLYGYMMEGGGPSGGRILSYLQGQQMRCEARTANQWATARGVFQVPAGTRAIRFFLNQAERKGGPQNGSAARFTALGLYLFATEQQAEAFAKQYQLHR
jgi:hypothetical protein